MQDIAEFVQKHANIPFELPDLAPFKELKVKIDDFEGSEGASAPGGKPEGGEEDSEDDPYLDEDENEEAEEVVMRDELLIWRRGG